MVCEEVENKPLAEEAAAFIDVQLYEEKSYFLVECFVGLLLDSKGMLSSY